MKWIEHKCVVVLNWTSEPYFCLDIEGVGIGKRVYFEGLVQFEL